MGSCASPRQVRNGHIDLPDKPGLGVEIDEKALRQVCEYGKELGDEYYYDSDGSVADW